MDPFQYRDSELCCEEVSLRALAAVAGTPAYIYSKAALLESLAGYGRAFQAVPHVVCYSVKANSNLGVLSALAKAGAGADIVSGGELYRALRAGVPPEKIVFSGVGKTRDEMREALKAGHPDVQRRVARASCGVLDEVAREMGKRAPVALRVNPDVDPQTHPYISTGLKTSKFGIPYRRRARRRTQKRRSFGRARGRRRATCTSARSSPRPRRSPTRSPGWSRS